MTYEPVQQCKHCLAPYEWAELRNGACWECRVALRPCSELAGDAEESAPVTSGRFLPERFSTGTPAGADILSERRA